MDRRRGSKVSLDQRTCCPRSFFGGERASARRVREDTRQAKQGSLVLLTMINADISPMGSSSIRNQRAGSTDGLGGFIKERRFGIFRVLPSRPVRGVSF